MDASDAAASLLTIFETTDQGGAAPSSDGPPGAQGAATARQELTQQPDHVRAQPAQGAPAAASGGLLLHPGYQTQQLLQPQNYAMPAMSAAPQLMSNPGKRTASGQPASDRPAARQTPQQPALQQQPSAAPPAAAAGVRGGDWDSSRPAITLDLSTKDWVLTSGTEWIPWVEVRDANRLFPPARTLSNPLSVGAAPALLHARPAAAHAHQRAEQLQGEGGGEGCRHPAAFTQLAHHEWSAPAPFLFLGGHGRSLVCES